MKHDLFSHFDYSGMARVITVNNELDLRGEDQSLIFFQTHGASVAAVISRSGAIVVVVVDVFTGD